MSKVVKASAVQLEAINSVIFPQNRGKTEANYYSLSSHPWLLAK